MSEGKRARWTEARAELVAFVVIAVVGLAIPFTATDLLPFTDLPFHAASTSIFRHHGDPSFHFQEQFRLTPLEVPYLSSYLLGAAFMLVMSATAATKAATFVMLLLLPAGLATLAWGMRKSPLLGCLGIPFMFSNLVAWGFVNFVGALGLTAIALGLTMRLVDRPSRALQIGVYVTLILVIFTHVSRFPFALGATGLAAIGLYPATRRLRPAIAPLAAALITFLVVFHFRSRAITMDVPLSLDTARLATIGDFSAGSFADPREQIAAKAWLYLAIGFFAVTAAFTLRGRAARAKEDRRFEVAAFGVVVGVTLTALLMFLVLPMEIGVWWYVYPRESVATIYFAFALVFDLPRLRAARVAAAAVLAGAALYTANVMRENYAVFHTATRDFVAIQTLVPKAPKLLYLIFDHGGSTRTNTPFIHLPAYVQAEKGGWLSFHFAVWNTSPVRYRERTEAGAVVPPPVPLRWEWTPDRFDVREHGAFFDWFLVRNGPDPTRLFNRDPEITFVAHEGTWWLYRRKKDAPPAP